MVGLILILTIILSFVWAVRSIEKDIDAMEKHLKNFESQNKGEKVEKNN